MPACPGMNVYNPGEAASPIAGRRHARDYPPAIFMNRSNNWRGILDLITIFMFTSTVLFLSTRGTLFHLFKNTTVMKPLTIVAFTFALSAFYSCRQGNNIDITYSDKDRYYYMDAEFDHRKTGRLELYLNRSLGKESNQVIVKRRMNTNVTLADNTNFYLRKEPGHITIKLDKNQNSEQAYRRVRSICEGMKVLMMK